MGNMIQERNIPKMNNSLLFFLKKPNEDGYVNAMINLEKKIEKDMIEVLQKLGIKATVKTDRYSLPFQHQIKVTQYGESYLNGAFESQNLYRSVLKELLEYEHSKIRFFIFAEILDEFPMGKVNYYFNYYVHY